MKSDEKKFLATFIVIYSIIIPHYNIPDIKSLEFNKMKER